MSQLSLEDLKEKCLDILNSDDHVQTLESLFARYANVMKSFQPVFSTRKFLISKFSI